MLRQQTLRLQLFTSNKTFSHVVDNPGLCDSLSFSDVAKTLACKKQEFSDFLGSSTGVRQKYTPLPSIDSQIFYESKDVAVHHLGMLFQ